MNLRHACFLGIGFLGIGIPLQAVRGAQGLTWRDDFNGAKGAPPDAGKWVFDLGADGWGNHELERYTADAANIFQDGQGHLVIRASKSNSGEYTSARIKTQGKFEFRYGKVAARIKAPLGQGLWPAFWMLGTDIEKSGWPDCGEIDVMENIGKEPSIIHGTVHGPGYSGDGGISFPYFLSKGRVGDQFHVYTAEWGPSRIRFSVDGHDYAEVTHGSLPTDARWVFDHPFFLLLNLAVGGDWPGAPDKTTAFPTEMLIDWVRVSQRSQ